VINRRQLLAASIAGIVGLTTWRFFRSSDADAIVAVLRKRLDYLILDEQGLYAYANDLAARKIISSSKLRLLDVAGPIYTHLVPSHRNAAVRELQHGEERVVSLYLLSSDFFANGADETKAVRYRGFYEPLRRLLPCSNPFSRPLVA
jgi:hypothetical protein